MKTKNQTEPTMLELAVTKAANEDGFTPPGTREDSQPDFSQTWSPKEVWRTRVKKTPAPFTRPETAPI
jgi:hypothetical protein